jgi:NAD(P)-dependent dehydrogenase (short-subunit alcohol dehydrogenase family)
MTVQGLQDKVALVTGAGGGIGRAASLAFADVGARVAVSDVHEKAAAETVAAIEAAGGKAVPIAADVSSRDQVDQLVRRTVAELGGLDFAFNNAGVPPRLMPLVMSTEEDWEPLMSVGLKGVWLCMRAELEHMLGQGSGVIVNAGSSVSLAGAPFMSAYSALKHGVLGLTKSAAIEAAPQGVRVNAVAPYFVNTPFLAGVPAEVQEQAKERNPSGRFAEPQEVAQAVVYLCSDAASYVTGVCLPVDGGRTAG